MNAGAPHHHKFFTVNVSSTYGRGPARYGENASGEEWSPAAKGGGL